ncbi:MAG TPA: histidinol dehydrogenase [Acidimicrobiales bacterium]|jgi:histidinol dehydrogenase|nr:histidinol dehydrogenase [Acidimicrobiales bacterium]
MLQRLDLRGRVQGTPIAELRACLPRPEVAGGEPVAAVRDIIAAVRRDGDAALRELTARFDGCDLPSPRVDPADIRAALDHIPRDLRAALEFAADRIRSFHESQVITPHVHVVDGMTIEARLQPVDRAGLYVPGGRAVYPSTVLMTAVPARVARVPEIALCVPPGTDGRVPAATLAAAAIAGVDEVYAVGGAQAVAALAYGTETIRPVDVIAGPGNIYVAIAKREVAGTVGVPSAFAGPSEIVVIADETTVPAFAAVDLMVQAEHGPLGLAWLITWSPAAADAITAELTAQVAGASRRADIEATLGAGGRVALVDSPTDAIAVANAIAPEHLQLLCADPATLVPLVRHAGAVFCGPFAPASIGDYVAGPSHVLPTDGTARFAGALTTRDFTKDIHVITLDRAAFERVAPHVERLAAAEGLAAHADSVRRRREWSR